jgi:pimeloyl-ACP methyl ester carboxylesterase
LPETQAAGVRIDYSDRGQGEPALLLMPGWCATRKAFGAMIELCAKHRRVLSLDWRGHGRSGTPAADFGESGLVEDALAVIQAGGAHSIVPVALAHSGWVAIELRRRLGSRISKIVLIDWPMLDAPAPFLATLNGLQDRLHWEESRNRLFSTWLQGVGNEAVKNFVQYEMGICGFEMWSRSGREIAAAYEKHGNPLLALEKLDPPVATVHIYAQPADPLYWQAQQSFAAEHPWFSAIRINAVSHFPTLEEPEEIAQAIENFVSSAEMRAKANNTD